MEKNDAGRWFGNARRARQGSRKLRAAFYAAPAPERNEGEGGFGLRRSARRWLAARAVGAGRSPSV